jgi:hypothetical protein
MWGIQYDPIVDRSYVFQWFDSPGSSQKTIYFESPGQILSIYFPTAFDQDGRFWILQETKQQDPQYRGADPSAWKTAQVVIFRHRSLRVSKKVGSIVGRYSSLSKPN